MLTVVASTAAYLRIRASGRLGVDDYRRFEPAFAAELKRVQAPIALLLDMQGFGGWTVGGFLRDLARLGPPQPPHLLEDRRRRRQDLAPLDHRRRRARLPRPDEVLSRKRATPGRGLARPSFMKKPCPTGGHLLSKLIDAESPRRSRR
jgi:hypothetical protein